MSKRIPIYPDRIKVLGSEGAERFVVVTNTPYLDVFYVDEATKYERTMVVAYDEGDRFLDLFDTVIPEGSHALVILPDCLFHSIPPEQLGRRKLLFMPCRSGITPLDGIEHFLRAGEETDPLEQEAFGAAFFEKGEVSSSLTLVDEEYGTTATFNHLHDFYEWHEQFGPMDWNSQQVYPAGEIACFIVPLKVGELKDEQFDIDGQLAFRGQLIVQSGPPSFLVEDQERIYAELATLADHAVIADVKQGYVTGLQASHPHCQPAVDMLETMFTVDSRFRRMYEVGFSMNRWATPWPGNCGLNEVYGGERGNLHIGLGMLPFSQYHLDMFLMGTTVRSDTGEVIFGGNPRPARMNRQKSAMCPCLTAV